MIEHTCELFLKRENNFSFVKPLTFKNIWTTWCSISKYTPKTNIYMDSTATMNAEKIRHTGSKYWWIIHPFSYARFYLKGFLMLDVLSSFPYDYITLRWRRLPGNNPYYIVTLINIMPLIKLTRYYTFNSNIYYLFVECENCWMMKLEDSSFQFRFKNAAFIVLENILSSGYGLFVPETDGPIIFNSILMIIGRIIVCYMLKPLREEIAFESCRRLIENVDIFKNLPRNILQSIVKRLKFELYLPNDVIIKAGTQGDCMYFLASGTVAVLTPTGKEVCHLNDGAYFGEIALLVMDRRRVASVVAVEVCEVYRLDRKDFRHCIEVNSELFAEIERIATERIETTVRVEEQHERFLMRPSRVTNLFNESKKI
ncbi:Potassium/sodium hyperpolarization-activated cyclic nucleotide-gated channel 4 [Acromyrmex echinatior]|uniref:Potassium/sodium hyperpolarization-activated cyclic nucleotide-gated channel 4 n=1 Tax=Acromyrmex echinatior TaxID=103372 RepID=F4WYR5_ACREC|nr:Potassium/sodium hyperpolarization-activated cyclic nucleotide-gated channel 4 [Acromyrmex echinatior]